jgi:hypothetical protein
VVDVEEAEGGGEEDSVGEKREDQFCLTLGG